jgi:signal transduction histidine kinase
MATALATLFRWSMSPILGDRAPFFMFIPSIIVTAWLGGFIDGVATTVLSIVVARVLILKDDSKNFVIPSQSLLFLIYASLGVVISGLVTSINRARIRAETAQNELSAAKEALEAAGRAKDAFLASLSHELRTPLTPVLMTVSALEADPLTPRGIREELGMIHRNIQMEAQLIDDLLDVSRITQGKLSLRFELMDAHVKIENAVEICRSDMNGKRLKLNLDLRAKQHCLRADPGRFQQVVWNLVKNAAKFTPEGGSITVTTSDVDGNRLRIQVVDDGIGIDPEMIPQLFNAFEQGGRETTQQFGGLGLGLAISKAIVDAHGGILTASSEGRGKGACFTIELPDTELKQVSPDALPEAPPNTQCRGVRILLVEDDDASLRVMTRILTKSGHVVTAVQGVAAALKASQGQDFDLLISDLGLPDGSGLDLMNQLRPLKGIALTGYGMEEDVRRSHDAGFLTHLTKPIGAGQLEMAISKLLLLES